ncbi:RNA polymerase sigma-70 factor, ECF subfamily [Thermoanaerobacter kivui]|uniref:RNA polymerase sigma-70 factor, ECF subfamily n=1 Tax=Thermoanaerobacter kivui TaxID=2325 RepID=A0A097AQB7_THEKI|nr:amidase domain-containing protein [Thermoanaerobacter kivui]AIS51998.1 RNA polymerase sigma-70 factor, ECF subfamily [Thermoanaerobacter kivui]
MSTVRKSLVKHIVWLLAVAVIIYSIGIKSNVVKAVDNDLKYQGEITNFIKQWIVNNWSYYYHVNNVDVEIADFKKSGDKVEGIAKVCVTKVLKAQKVGELPYIKGMLRKINMADYDVQLQKEYKINKVLSANSGVLTKEKAQRVVKMLDDRYSELKEYIGVPDESYMILKFEAELRGSNIEENAIKLYAEQMNTFVPAEELIPKSPAEYENAGYKEMESKLIEEGTFAVAALYPYYDRLKARDYANTWTSNATTYCPHNIALQDIAKWNNAKWPYYDCFCHNDCADYVSQALNAGGIPVDPGKWERLKDSSNNWAWTYVPGLKNYMLNQKGYWKRSTWESAAAGGVIVIPDSHVMMIVKNDTIERLFSAHTNDRLKYPYGKNTTWEYYVLWE